MEYPSTPIGEITLGRRIGSGSHSHAHHVQGREGVAAIVLRKFEGMNDPAVSRHLRDQVASMTQIRQDGIQANGNLIAPVIHGFLVNHDELNLGYLMEYIPCEDLRDFAGRREVAAQLLAAALDQARHQLSILHAAGYVHGDPNPGNVRVELQGTEIRTRWFDFEVGRSPQRPDHWYTVANDREIFERYAITLSAPGYRESYTKLRP